jgi:hypothetical protein
MNYVKNLHRLKVKNCKIHKPIITKTISKSLGSLSAIRYYVKNKNGDFILQATSKDDSFNDIISVDVSNNRYQITEGMMIDSGSPNNVVAGVMCYYAIKYKPVYIEIKAGVNIVSDCIMMRATMFSSFWEKVKLKWEQDPNAVLAIGIPSVIYLGIVGFVFVKQMIKIYKGTVRWNVERTSDKVEKVADKNLFIEQKDNDPAFIHYDAVKKSINSVLEGNLRACILCGPPGMSKTYLVKRCLHFNGMSPGSDYNTLKGSSVGLKEFFLFVYQNKDKVLILDDFDTPMRDPDMINILKAMTDSYKQRRVTLPYKEGDDSTLGLPSDVPTRFDFGGKVIIITNMKESQMDDAVMSRAITEEINFDPKKMFKVLDIMLKHMEPKEASIKVKREVLLFIKGLYKKNKNVVLNFRNFQDAVCLKLGIPSGWERCVMRLVKYK